MEKVVDRFLRYVKIDTQSSSLSDSFPSTEKQMVLLSLLKEEMIAIGMSNVEMDKYGYVMGSVPSNIDHEVPVIGFVAHVDTSPDFTGENVSPQRHYYTGGDIMLNKELGIVITRSDFPELSRYEGKELITTDGTTLLGADDKAGIAEIMCAMEYLINNPQIEHGEIRVGFTPDEEIGRGVDFFDVERFGAKYAYTLDGSHYGELEYENFNAAGAVIDIQGLSVHPGYAKNKMINALNVAHDIHSLIPANQRPENTEHREGFFHLCSLSGGIDTAKMEYIIRNHDRELFEQQKQLMLDVVEKINQQYRSEVATISLKNQYYNMLEIVEQHYEVVQKAIDAMRVIGIEPDIKPIRGGTDGSRLSFMNLPCPNLFAGGVNYHGRYEFIAVETMENAVCVIAELAHQWSR